MSASNRMTASDTMPVPFRHGQYNMIAEVGRGSFARVMKARNASTGAVCAVKMVAKSRLNPKLMSNLKTEIQIMKSLKHPGILQLEETYESTGHVNLVMEFAKIGDLAKLTRYMKSIQQVPALHEMQRRYPSQYKNLHPIIVRLFVRQLVDSMKFLSDRHLIHRDIKPQNILLDRCDVSKASPEQFAAIEKLSRTVGVSIHSWRWLPLIKLADFGFARHLPSTSLAETLCGSPLYMGPEILRYEHYDGKADLWSLGAVVYELLVGRPPYKAKNHIELLKKIDTTDVEFPADGHFDKDMVKFTFELLKRNPVERLNFEGTYHHEAMKCDIVGLRPDDYPGTEPMPINTETPVPPTTRTASGPPRTAAPIVHNPPPPSAERKFMDAASMSTGSPRRSSKKVSQLHVADGFVNTPVTAVRSPSSSTNLAPTPRRVSSRDSSRGPIMGLCIHQAQSNHAGGMPSPLNGPCSTEMKRAIDEVMAPEVLLMERHNSHGVRPDNQNRRSKLANYVTPDSAVDADYVVIEKKQVEVNAMADEMAASPQANYRNQLIHRSQSTTAVNIPTRPSHHKRNSVDISPSHSPSSITRAIQGAGRRFFGSAFNPQRSLRGGPSPPMYNPYAGSAPNLGPGLITDGRPASNHKRQSENQVAQTIEDYANRSDCIYGFAEIKYQQLVPEISSSIRGITNEKDTDEGGGLTEDAIVILSEEAVMLYVKALDILANAIDYASSWWNRRAPGEFTQTSQRINATVQWLRNRFNETLEKVEIVSERLSKAQLLVPENHPAHPSNHTVDGTMIIGTGSLNVYISSKTTAEKLIYDRALDMCKHAAGDEMCKRNLPSCETYYSTALRMVEALYDRFEDDKTLANESGDDDQQQQEDHLHLVKMAHAIRCRLSATRAELRAMRDNDRVQPVVGSGGHRRSGSITPVSITSN